MFKFNKLMIKFKGNCMISIYLSGFKFFSRNITQLDFFHDEKNFSNVFMFSLCLYSFYHLIKFCVWIDFKIMVADIQDDRVGKSCLCYMKSHRCYMNNYNKVQRILTFDEIHPSFVLVIEGFFGFYTGDLPYLYFVYLKKYQTVEDFCFGSFVVVKSISFLSWL